MIFWKIRRDQKDILKLADLYLDTSRGAMANPFPGKNYDLADKARQINPGHL